MARVSVVIPCYNQGQFVDEAIQSVLAQTWQDFEIIVVNDGSTDPLTVACLEQLNVPETRLLHTDNQGLPSARNNGIRVAQGEYILPLDADDRISPTYLEQAVALLDNDPELGIVYCKGEYFGDKNGEWLLPDYSLAEMLLNNIIFCTAFFRKADWEKVGGFDPAMVHGWEDYDFWLSLLELGRKVEKIPEVLFYYRIRSDSMLRSREKKQKVEMLVKIFHKHERLYKEHIAVLFDRLVDIKGLYLEAVLFCRRQNSAVRQRLGSRKVDMQSKRLVFEDLALHENMCLELCPVNEQAIIKIKSVQVQSDYQETVPVSMQSNATLVDENLHYFNSKEPLLKIYPKQVWNEKTCLVIDLDYLIIGEAVSEHLINKLHHELISARPAFANLKEYINKKTASQVSSFKNIAKKLLFFCTSRDYRVILRSGLFDQEFYLKQYPDVFFQNIDPLIHYCKTGWLENRKPYASFDPEECKKTCKVPAGINPLLYYIITVQSAGHQQRGHG